MNGVATNTPTTSETPNSREGRGGRPNEGDGIATTVRIANEGADAPQPTSISLVVYEGRFRGTGPYGDKFSPLKIVEMEL